ncbi:MAG: hypothetical protein GY765_34355 [bacterium]|nr:hypothetical protein [bacterium]
MSALKTTIKQKRAKLVEKIAELKAQLAFIDDLMKPASKKKSKDGVISVKKKTEEAAPWKLIFKIRPVLHKHRYKWMGATEIAALMIEEGVITDPSPAFASTISGVLVRERDEHSWIEAKNMGKRACVYRWKD